MFRLNEKHLENGGKIWLHSQIIRSSKRDKRSALIYELNPIGFTAEMRDVVCRVTRFTASFSDGHPSYPQSTHSRVWERVDLPMTVEDTLTAHVLHHLTGARADGGWETLDRTFTAENSVGKYHVTEPKWFATLTEPKTMWYFRSVDVRTGLKKEMRSDSPRPVTAQARAFDTYGGEIAEEDDFDWTKNIRLHPTKWGVVEAIEKAFVGCEVDMDSIQTIRGNDRPTELKVNCTRSSYARTGIARVTIYLDTDVKPTL